MQTSLILDLATSKQINELAPNQCIVVPVTDSESAIIVKTAFQLHVYRNRCPHRNKPLTDAHGVILDESHSLLECTHHGAQFLLHNGQCVSGPCPGSRLNTIVIKYTGQHYTLIMD